MSTTSTTSATSATPAATIPLLTITSFTTTRLVPITSPSQPSSPISASSGSHDSWRVMVVVIWAGVCVGVPMIIGGFLFRRKWRRGLKHSRIVEPMHEPAPHRASTAATLDITLTLDIALPEPGSLDLENGMRRYRCLPKGPPGHKRQLAKAFNALMETKIANMTAIRTPPPTPPRLPSMSVHEGDSAGSDPPPPYDLSLRGDCERGVD